MGEGGRGVDNGIEGDFVQGFGEGGETAVYAKFIPCFMQHLRRRVHQRHHVTIRHVALQRAGMQFAHTPGPNHANSHLFIH